MKITGDVSWGIIGCGDVCEVKSGPAFSKVGHSSLIAVMRRDGEKAKDFARRHHVPRAYDDAQKLITDRDVNAVYIATPPSHHESLAISAMQAGKPVYIEKPVALNAASCERILEASRKLGVPASVAHYRRGLPLFRKVRAVINAGTIGKAGLIVARTLNAPSPKIGTPDYWRIDPAVSGGGLFYDLSPHQLDIFYWIFGAPQDVRAFSLNQHKRYSAPDVTIVDAVFPGDVCLHGVWAFNVASSAEEEICEIIGDKGRLRFSFFRKSELEITTDAGKEVLSFEYPENIEQPMIAEVVKFFRGESPNPCSLEDALVTMKIMESAA